MTTLDLETLVIAPGKHDTVQEGMCVMEAVAYVAGEAHSDQPRCACPVIGAFLRRWNDDLSDTDRQILKPLIPQLVGTRATTAVEERRAWLMIDWYVREHTPAWLELAKLGEAAGLRELPEIVDLITLQAAGEVLRIARSSAAAAGDAAWAAARAAAGDAAWAAAGDAAGDAAWAAAGAAAWDAARKALRPTTEALQASAIRLVERMIAVGQEAA